jgi:hypothetical protein
MKWLSTNIEEHNDLNPLELDWGLVTADGDKDGFTVHVINSDLTDKSCLTKTQSLVFNKYKYYKLHLPPDRIQKFIFDIRGQDISDRQIEVFKRDLLGMIEKNENEPKFKMEFLR